MSEAVNGSMAKVLEEHMIEHNHLHDIMKRADAPQDTMVRVGGRFDGIIDHM